MTFLFYLESTASLSTDDSWYPLLSELFRECEIIVCSGVFRDC